MIKAFIASLIVLFTVTACSTGPTYKTALTMINQTNVEIGERGGWCSGTVVDKKNRIIATAQHCVDNLIEKFQYQTWDAEKKKYVTHTIVSYRPVEITHRVFNENGWQIEAVKLRGHVVAPSYDYDAALIWIDSAYTFKEEAKLSSTPLKYGDEVFNLGNPYLIPSVITFGHVIAPRINTKVAHFIPVDAIVTDATIGPGHSGGASYNANGEYIGMTNWKPPSSNHTILLPVRYLKKLMKGYYEKEGLVLPQSEGTLWSRLTSYFGS